MTDKELSFNESDRVAYLYENKCKIELANQIVLLERELKEAIDYIFKEEIETKDDRLKRALDNLCKSTH
tara:strand:+ start:1239 stop:1445 length:207 start_codon:yes stop_codon:yes gene_type:complete